MGKSGLKAAFSKAIPKTNRVLGMAPILTIFFIIEPITLSPRQETTPDIPISIPRNKAQALIELFLSIFYSFFSVILHLPRAESRGQARALMGGGSGIVCRPHLSKANERAASEFHYRAPRTKS
jgi:hypothetical protein